MSNKIKKQFTAKDLSDEIAEKFEYLISRIENKDKIVNSKLDKIISAGFFELINEIYSKVGVPIDELSSTKETEDSDIQDFLEGLGTPPSKK